MYKNKTLIAPKLVNVLITANNCHCGVALTAINLPPNCIMFGIARQGQFIIAVDEPTIYCEDYILAVGLSSAITPTLEFILKKTHPVSWSVFRSNLV